MDPVRPERAALPPFLLRRREFLRSVGAGALALPGVAGPFVRAAAETAATPPDHFVPLDKQLDPKWVARLFERGAPTVRRGEQRAACAMPCGGIGAGQLYVGSDGTLRTWELFNRNVFTGWGQRNYEFTIPPRVVEHGFAIALLQPDGTTRVRRLREEDVPNVEFTGQHPIATFVYPADGADAADRASFPIEVRLEVMAPFIPLDAEVSTFPVTLFRVTLANRGSAACKVVLLSWLENVAAPDSGDLFGGRRENQIVRDDRSVRLDAIVAAPDAISGASAPPERFADFDGDGWNGWRAEGNALGGGPARGAEPGQQPVTGFDGRGLVNTFHPDDRTVGTLTSPVFTIHRRFINFRIGGGSQPRTTCVELLIDDQVVASAAGKESEALAWAHFDVAAHAGRTARLRIADREQGPWGHVCVDQIEFADAPKLGPSGDLATQPDFGSLHWIALERPTSATADWNGSLEEFARVVGLDGEKDSDWDKAHVPSAATPGSGPPSWERRPNRPIGVLASTHALASGQGVTRDFALAWWSPNHARGHWYAERFGRADALVDAVLESGARWINQTRAWRDLYYGGTLPHWLLERLHAPVANLQTNVTQVWRNGRFWAWEGVGCCEGTCTHVWNYEHALARLFPSLARSTRELQDLGEGFHADGLVGYRGIDVYAADGQAGTVLKCWREHQMSSDDTFLRRNWPKIRKVVEYLLRRDADEDGLLEDAQHNTYDIEFFGANTFVGSLYLAALRAAEEMATRCAEPEFAARCRRVFESGRKKSVERLWNGEYFVQQVDLTAHPKYQYADGCLADQLFGQGWARQVGLGDLYPPELVRTALRSIWNYCWAPDVGPQTARHLPERYFARRGEAGLFLCTWPKSRHLGENGVRYRDEIWSGIEYQVAGHMIWEGMVEEGLAIVKGIDERYDGRVHNPWNEIECGDHYARALASWGCYLALLGFEYDGPRGVLGFAPRLGADDFKAGVTTAASFLELFQRREAGRQQCGVRPLDGRLVLRELRLELPDDSSRWRSAVRRGRDDFGTPPSSLPHELLVESRRAVVTFSEPLVLDFETGVRVDFERI